MIGEHGEIVFRSAGAAAEILDARLVNGATDHPHAVTGVVRVGSVGVDDPPYLAQSTQGVVHGIDGPRLPEVADEARVVVTRSCHNHRQGEAAIVS